MRIHDPRRPEPDDEPPPHQGAFAFMVVWVILCAVAIAVLIARAIAFYLVG